MDMAMYFMLAAIVGALLFLALNYTINLRRYRPHRGHIRLQVKHPGQLDEILPEQLVLLAEIQAVQLKWYGVKKLPFTVQLRVRRLGSSTMLLQIAGVSQGKSVTGFAAQPVSTPGFTLSYRFSIDPEQTHITAIAPNVQQQVFRAQHIHFDRVAIRLELPFVTVLP